MIRTTLCCIGALAALSLTAVAGEPLVRGPVVDIPGSHGKFDFLGVDPARHRLLAAHEKDGTADFIDLDQDRLITRIKTGPTVGLAVDPETGRYFASVQDDKRIAVIDAQTLAEIASIAMPGPTDAIMADPKHRRIYVTNDNGRFLWVVDADALKRIAAIPIPGAPECIALDPPNNRIYLNIKADNEVAAIDMRTNAIVATWPTAPAIAPHGLVFDASLHRVISSGDNGKLVAIDTTSGRVTASADIVPHVDQIAFDPALHRVYCAGPGTMSVVASTSAGLTVLGAVATADNAKNVAVDPRTHNVWTTFTDGTNSHAQSFTAQ